MSLIGVVAFALDDVPCPVVQRRPHHIPCDVAVHARQVDAPGARQEQAGTAPRRR